MVSTLLADRAAVVDTAAARARQEPRGKVVLGGRALIAALATHRAAAEGLEEREATQVVAKLLALAAQVWTTASQEPQQIMRQEVALVRGKGQAVRLVVVPLVRV